MNIKYAVGNGTTSDLWYLLWKQLRGKGPTMVGSDAKENF